MKRCPECRRDYYDDTLLYCLDDGNALLEGPAMASADDEPPTAILSEPGAIATGFQPSESPTRAHINTTDQTAIFPRGTEAEPQENLGELSERQSLSANRAAKPLGVVIVAVLVLVGGFCGYRYFSSVNSKQIESIAVMPFVNESGNADVEYLSDGMTETLISSLTQLPNLNVKARSSVFRYKGKDTDVKTIGKELNVQAILTGRVVQRGDQLMLSLELVDVATENAIWSQQYTRKQTDLVSLQSEIARDVSDKLRVKLSGADERKLAKSYTQNAEAYQLYLKGRFHWNKRTRSDFEKAAEYFQQAIDRDVGFALAYSGLADSLSLMSVYGFVTPRETMPRAKQAALKAITIDDTLAEGHTSLGFILNDYELDQGGAEREYKRALELNPNYPTALLWYGEMLSQVGRHDESIAVYKRALAVDPFSLILNRMYGWTLYCARQNDASIEQLQKTINLDPNFPSAHISLHDSYFIAGKYPEAVEEFVRFQELNGETEDGAGARRSFSDGGFTAFLRYVTDERRRGKSNEGEIIRSLVALGEKERALAEIGRSLENGDNYIVWARMDPRMDPLRDDPRFKDLLKKAGFPE